MRPHGVAIRAHELALGDLREHPITPSPVQLGDVSKLFDAWGMVPLHRCWMDDAFTPSTALHAATLLLRSDGTYVLVVTNQVAGGLPKALES
jgi:hypothetical protein